MRLKLLEVYNFPDKIRLGEKSDGGYVICKLDGSYDCYISCGVSDEASFDRDFINLYNGIGKDNSFAFDGTIPDYPWHYTNNITYLKKNIADFNDNKHTNLDYLISKYNDIFLAMDIEGGEYPWLLSLTDNKLDKFKQIAIEFHEINGRYYNSCSFYDKVKCLEKLNKTHYIMHAHGNNNSGIQNGVPDVIELTYVNKKCIKNFPSKNEMPLPIINLDYPNKVGTKDYELNYYPFVNLI